MSAPHMHSPKTAGNERRLWLALGLTGSFMVAEVAAGVIANSLALISDAAHMLTDSAALAIALAAARVARRPADAWRTYGYHRFEILAAAFNAVLLFGVAIYIIAEAYARLRAPTTIEPMAMLVVACAGLAVNLVSMRLLSGGKESSLNIKGAYLEVWSDMLGSLGVIAGAVVIRATGWAWVDPVIAVAIGLWVLPRTWTLLKESLNILLEGVPLGMDAGLVAAAIREAPGVLGVHDLHVWALTSGKPCLTAHVVHEPTRDRDALVASINAALMQRFAIVHSTLQLETTPCGRSEDGDGYGLSVASDEIDGAR